MEAIKPTGKERKISGNEVIISKTDNRGIIKYANEVFCKISSYNEIELIDKPHNVVRHPDMPGCIFRLMWGELKEGKEFYGYVKNMASNGDHYWVMAWVSPIVTNRVIKGFLSYRLPPNREVLPKIQELYDKLLEVERSEENRNKGIEKSYKMLVESYKPIMSEVTKQDPFYADFVKKAKDIVRQSS